jgi:hypothetical protein
MGARDADLVDEKLRRLVGVDVVDAGRHSNDEVAIDSHGKVMSRIGEKFGAPTRIDREVKHIVGDTLEHRRVTRLKNAYIECYEKLNANVNERNQTSC